MSEAALPQPGPQQAEEISPAQLSHRLVRSADRAVLATAMRGDSGWPYASLVLSATTQDGWPLLLLSDLAEHSKNIQADPRVSLLFDGTAGLESPLTGPRLSLLGHARESGAEAERARFLARHPSAALYAGMKDFRLYRVEPARGHLVAGFGRIHWLAARELRYEGPPAHGLAAAEADILAQMNAEHGKALAHYARALLRLEGGDWVMTGIDPEGLDLRRGGQVARLAFAGPVTDAESARRELLRLAHAGGATG
jgi:putative heme iron utilization protein